jgi:ABC-2 type transport system ATP-binding protein
MPVAAGSVLSCRGLSRWYGQVIGINDVSCQIPPGITALLGPNGAGKSTMLKLITGLLRPTTGRCTVFGEKPFANPRVYQRLGYCPEIENSYEEMTGRELVTMLGAMAGLSRAALQTRVPEILEMVGMTLNADRKIGGYSKGMRQRIKIAQGTVHDPDVLILDEPLNGLDPVGRREITDLMHRLAAQGKCIVVSSHIL